MKLIIFLIISLNLSSQTIDVSTCINYSFMRFDYSTQDGSFDTDLFGQPLVGFGLKIGKDLIEKENITYGMSLNYNRIGAKLSSFYSPASYINDKIILNQILLTPYAKFNLFKSKKINYFGISGINLIYNLSVNDFSSTPELNQYMSKQLNNFGLGLMAGFGCSYKLSDKLNLNLAGSYNQHITNLSDKEIGTNRTLIGRYQFEVLIYSHINFFQFQSGITYNLNH